MSRVGGVDLGRLAAAYGHRVEEDAAVRAAAAAAAARLHRGSLAIDVGGGTGAHAAVFAASGSRVLVVDRSTAMALAARRTGTLAVVGDGAGLPVGDACADLVYFHLSIHHGPPDLWISEGARVARPGGLVWVWTLAPAHHRTSFLARWFPSVAPLDEARFPDPDVLARAMLASGLVDAMQSDHVEHVTRSAGSWVEAVRAGFVSTLHLVAADEIEAGLAAFAAAHPDPTEPVAYTIAFRRVSATRPSLPS
ncbi:MAG: class I SAM-dependent methyltransferase [Acidimicrobiia bacterium]|nr:class I SAM-dependent methyltransferase [Acidimicrobiia bacterium]